MVDVSTSPGVAAIAAYRIEDLQSPLGLLIPSAKGVFFRSYTPEMPSELTRYLGIRAGCEVFRIHREVNESGQTILRKEAPSLGSKSYCATLAQTLTVHPYNEQHFLFRPVETVPEIFEGAVLVAGAECRSDLFQVSHAAATPWLCQCGTVLTFEATNCPSCQAWNSISDSGGDLLTKASDRWKRIANEALVRVEEAQSRCSKFSNTLKSVRRAILDGPKVPDDADDKVQAQLLLEFYKQIFAPAALDRRLLEDFSRYPAITVAGYLTHLGMTAVTMRGEWLPGAMAGWVPSSEFRQELSNRIKGIWSEPLEKTRDGLLALAKAAVCYKPFERRYRAVANRGGFGDFWHHFGRHALTAFSAVASGGLSLAFKAGVVFLKSEKEAKQYEAFTMALDDAAQRILLACESIRTALRNEEALKATLSSGLALHLANLAAHDFSLEAANGKAILANRIRGTVGVPSSFPLEKTANVQSRPISLFLFAVAIILASVILFFLFW